MINRDENKIFIGLTDIASQITDFKKGFEDNNIETITAVHSKHSVIVDGEYDFNIESQIPECFQKAKSVFGRFARRGFRTWYKNKVWRKALRKCDIFLFMWSSFRNDYSDYASLKKCKKKIMTFFVGGDIRWKPACDQDFLAHSVPIIEYEDYSRHNALDQKLKYLRIAEKFADLIFSQPSMAQLALRPYYQFFVPIDLTRFKENCRQRRYDPIVLHAPSVSVNKGTKYVLSVFERLQKEGIKFKSKIVQGLPYSEAIKQYIDADILVGQMFGVFGGKQEREALACGTVVLSSIGFEYPQTITSDCPIIDVNPENLYAKLRSIILDYPRRVELAKKGRAYVDKYHDARRTCKRILDLLESDNPEPDFYPTFFRERIIPESKEVIPIYNKYTNYVKDCDWYKKYIAPGKEKA